MVGKIETSMRRLTNAFIAIFEWENAVVPSSRALVVASKLSPSRVQQPLTLARQEHDDWHVPRVLDTSAEAMKEVGRGSKKEMMRIAGPETAVQRRERMKKESAARTWVAKC